MSTLDLVAQAERRARLAAMLGRLLLQEPGPDAADLVAGLPELEPLGRPDLELAATFERLFLREIPLFESVFLGGDGQRGGPVVGDVLDTYRRHDFDETTTWRVPSPDHLGIELRFLGHLAAREAAAWQDDRPDEATKLVEAQREFLALHLGQWGEVATTAVLRRAGDGPYRVLASAVAELLAAESERLRPDPDHPGLPPVDAIEPPERLGPARLARWLLAPSTCGAWLSADDLGAAAVSLGIPWRPSDPRSHFRHAVEAAVDGGDLAELLGRLAPGVGRWRDRHAERETAVPGAARTWRAWRRQAEATLALIERLAAQATVHDDGPVVVVVRGPGHDERTAAARAVLTALRPLGVRIAVDVDLRPRLARALEELLEAGAGEVLLVGGAVSAVAFHDGGDDQDREARHLREADVIVRLVPDASPVSVTVEPGGDPALVEEVSRSLPR